VIGTHRSHWYTRMRARWEPVVKTGPYLSGGTQYDRLWSDVRSTSALVYVKSLWVRGRCRGHHPAHDRMPFNRRSFVFAATAIELALLLGYGRSKYTGNWTNVNSTTPLTVCVGAAYRTAARFTRSLHAICSPTRYLVWDSLRRSVPLPPVAYRQRSSSR